MSGLGRGSETPAQPTTLGETPRAEIPRADDEPIHPRALGKAVVAPPSSLAPSRRILAGRFARLEPLDPARHADALYEAAREDAATFDYMPYGPFDDRAAFEAWLRAQSAALDPVFYALRDHVSERALGMASFLEIAPQHGAIEIGHIWFAPTVRRSATTSEALLLMIRHAMDDLGSRRLQWKCDALNQKSRAAARRLGFRFEGVLSQARIVKGRNRDTAYYSILDREWPALRRIHASWLEGLDDTGRSAVSLSEATGARA